MYISKVYINNFKGIKELTINLTNGINILVGKNDSGKSSIIEAIHLALSGYYRGVKLDICEDLFNKQSVDDYVSSFKPGFTKKECPEILIEIYFDGIDEKSSFLKGSNNHLKEPACGLSFRVSLDEKCRVEYATFVKNNTITGLPIEYYNYERIGFNDDSLPTPLSYDYRSVIIDNALSNFSDKYSKRMAVDYFDEESRILMTQEQRQMIEHIMGCDVFKKVNEKIKENNKLKHENVSLSFEKSSKTSWESSLTTEIDKIPFENIGRGEQCIVKTFLALSNPKIENKNIILIEEPESHLSFSNLHKLVDTIVEETAGHQILVTTHNSFVLNRLGLDNLLLISKNENVSCNNECLRFSSLQKETIDFFRKRSGYDTLRFILAEKTILVEGDSDDLIIQKAFVEKFNGVLPFAKGVDVMTVSLSFLRFLEIASKLKMKVAVITDNDGDIQALESKYSIYMSNSTCSNIKIFYAPEVVNDPTIPFKEVSNQNTLEPCIVRDNAIKTLNQIFGTKCENNGEMMAYMISNKTQCALKIYESGEKIKIPQYIEEAVKWIIMEN